MSEQATAIEPATGAGWITPEEYARRIKLPLEYVQYMAAGSKKTAKRFDDRDILRVSRGIFRIWWQAPTASGFARPRLVERD